MGYELKDEDDWQLPITPYDSDRLFLSTGYMPSHGFCVGCFAVIDEKITASRRARKLVSTFEEAIELLKKMARKNPKLRAMMPVAVDIIPHKKNNSAMLKAAVAEEEKYLAAKKDISILFNSEASEMATGAAVPVAKRVDDKAPPVVENVEIKTHDGPLILPNSLSLDSAIAALTQRRDFLNKTGKVVEEFDCFPWDGALALAAVLKSKFGWTPPPGASIMQEVAFGEKAEIPWGVFSVPGLTGQMQCGYTESQEGLLCFRVLVEGLNRDLPAFKEILKEAREYQRSNSIYRGKAFSLDFRDNDDEITAFPKISFIDTTKIGPDDLILARDTHNAVWTNLLTPIQRVRELKANKLPVKRGVLLAGMYGTGKTLAASVAANLAVASGVTFVYLPNVNDLPRALKFLERYQDPAAVVFAEDIDEVMVNERTSEINDILNSLDGVGSKSQNVITVLTTNNVDKITPAMLRPGRLDAVIELETPDAAAAGQLVVKYGAGSLTRDIDLQKCGAVLAGMIPAVIAEVVKRAKMVQLRLTPSGTRVEGVGTEAVIEAAITMRRQLELINKPADKPTDLAVALAVLGDAMGEDADELTRKRA